MMAVRQPEQHLCSASGDRCECTSRMTFLAFCPSCAPSAFWTQRPLSVVHPFVASFGEFIVALPWARLLKTAAK